MCVLASRRSSGPKGDRRGRRASRTHPLHAAMPNPEPSKRKLVTAISERYFQQHHQAHPQTPYQFLCVVMSETEAAAVLAEVLLHTLQHSSVVSRFAESSHRDFFFEIRLTRKASKFVPHTLRLPRSKVGNIPCSRARVHKSLYDTY